MLAWLRVQQMRERRESRGGVVLTANGHLISLSYYFSGIHPPWEMSSVREKCVGLLLAAEPELNKRIRKRRLV